MVQTLNIAEPLTHYRAQQVMAHMLWPGDKARQQTVLATLYKALLLELERSGVSLSNDPEIQGELDAWKERLGGWSAIVEAPAMSEVDEQIRFRRKQGALVGSIFMLIYAWSKEPVGKFGGPSLNKVMRILKAEAKQYGEAGYTDAQMKGAWLRFRTVAHFWAALEFVDGWRASGCEWTSFSPYDRDQTAPASEGRYSIDEWRRVFLLAGYFYKFGTEYKADHGSEPLLDPRDAVPIAVPLEWKLRVPVIRFPERLLRFVSPLKNVKKQNLN